MPMKRMWWGALVILSLIQLVPSSVFALETTPSPQTPVKINGPLLITGYSFSGHSLRYAQVHNASNEVVSLDGWKVSIEYTGSQTVYATLSGKIAPLKYVTIANISTIPSATFTYMDGSVAADPVLTTVSLTPPLTTMFNGEVATPGVTASTVRVAGTPATFYFARNISTSTGNFLTTFTAFIPGSNFTVVSDGTYVAPSAPGLQIVEIFPNSSICAPNSFDSSCSDYVKVQNVSTSDIDLTMFRLRTGSYAQSASSSNTTATSGVLEAGEFMTFPLSLSASGSWVWLEDRYGTTRYDASIVEYPSSASNHTQAWAYDQSLGSWRWTNVLRPGTVPSEFSTPQAVNKCTGLSVNEIAANAANEGQFIEIINRSDVAIELGGCLLQTNRSTTATYVFESETLAPMALKTIFIKDTALTLTKTTTGSVYTLSSDMSTETDAVSYADLKENTSFSMVDGTWVATYSITPGGRNVWQRYPACEDGYARNLETGNCNKIVQPETTLADCGVGKYRSPDTNRCRSLEALATALTPCDAGQYRNPETNRCRGLASTASTLAPCATNQERNPDTNRCRAITSAAGLAPCSANQERNPDTNRCRNKASTTTADFPVEAVAESGQAAIGWWAFGGVGTLAAGYAGWEWRREVSTAIRKFGRFVIGRF